MIWGRDKFREPDANLTFREEMGRDGHAVLALLLLLCMVGFAVIGLIKSII